MISLLFADFRRLNLVKTNACNPSHL